MIPTHMSLVPAGGQEPRPATVMIPTSTTDRPRGDGPALPEEAASRPDIPIRREVRRASKRAAIEAALEENRDAALADIDGNILARSSQAPFQSRVRTWTDVCHAWAQEPWPITAEKLRMVAASFRRGGYRSVQNYFDSATTYQEHFLGIVVEPLLRKAMRRYTRAVTRGLPGARLKAIFPFDLLAKLAAVLEPAHLEPWSPWNSAHAVDAMILAVWFMLREIEFAAARTQDIDVLVVLRIPLHKVATGGETELTERRLQCACRASVLPLRPYHAARRHVDRLKAAGAWARGKPLFPDGARRTWAKGEGRLTSSHCRRHSHHICRRMAWATGASSADTWSFLPFARKPSAKGRNTFLSTSSQVSATNARVAVRCKDRASRYSSMSGPAPAALATSAMSAIAAAIKESMPWWAGLRRRRPSARMA